MLHPRQKLTDLKLCQLTAHLFNQSSIFGDRPPAGATRDNQTGTFQLGEGFLHGVRIDACLCSEVADTGKPGAGRIESGYDFMLEPVNNLGVNRSV